MRPEQLIDLHSSHLKLSKMTIEKAKALARRAKSGDEIKHDAYSSIAAVSTYVAANETEQKPQKLLANVVAVSTKTIRNYNEIVRKNRNAEF